MCSTYSNSHRYSNISRSESVRFHIHDFLDFQKLDSDSIRKKSKAPGERFELSDPCEYALYGFLNFQARALPG